MAAVATRNFLLSWKREGNFSGESIKSKRKDANDLFIRYSFLTVHDLRVNELQKFVESVNKINKDPSVNDLFLSHVPPKTTRSACQKSIEFLSTVANYNGDRFLQEA